MAEIVFLVTKIPCNSVTKRQDQTLNVRVNFTYKGPAKTGRLGAVVTQQIILAGVVVDEFDEIDSTGKEVDLILPDSPETQNFATDIIGLPLAGCKPKSGYGIKVYVLDLDGKPESGCLNILTVRSFAPELNITSLTVS